MDWAGPSVLPQKRQAKITAHYITYVILCGLGRALGPSAKATTATAKRQCERPVLRSVSCTSYPSTFPCHIRAWGYMCYMQATQVKSGMAGRVGELALLTLTDDSSFPRGPAKSRSRGHPKQPESEVKRRSGAPCSHCAASALASSPPSFTRALLPRSGKNYKFPCQDNRQPAAVSRQRTHMHARRASLQARVEPQREQLSAICVKAAKMAP